MKKRFEQLGLMPPESRTPIPGGGPQSVVEILDPAIRREPNHLALVGRHGRYTYAELDRAANQAAHALAALGVQPGERVAACLPNDVDIVIAFLGAQRLGAIWVGINRPLAPREKAYILRDCGARVYLADPEMLQQVKTVRSDLPELENILAVDPSAPDLGWLGAMAAAPEGPRPDVEIDAFDPAAIAYTSGTTGFPKGAVHSQHNMLVPGAVSTLTGKIPATIVQGVLLPLTILNLMIRGPLAAFYGARRIVCMDRHDPEGIAAWVRSEGVGTFDAVPTMYQDLLTHPNVKPDDLRSLTEPLMGGAECPPETIALYQKRFGREVGVGYGMTEAPTAVTWSDGEQPPAPGFAAKAVPQVEIHIVGEKDQLLPPGEIGEICVAPATTGRFVGVYTPMLGYWGNHEATSKALRNGRYYSGDMGYLDEQGNLYVRGRRNELILRGGANVYPAEVERVLQEHPAVTAAAVLGIPDERLGERVVAAVELRLDASATEEDLRAHMRENLAHYKVPDRILFVSDMPRNAMQKIMKQELAALFRPVV